MKMTKNFKNLSESFDIDDNISIDCELVESNKDNISDIEKVENNNFASVNNDIKKDYEYTRGNLYSLIEKGQEAINGILELAQESEMPRAYEVAGQLIKNVADATDKLMELQKKLKDIEEDKQKGPTTVNNALFVGSTSELAKFLKQQTQNEDI
jgi:predicted house-cleaning noncanonical NTP pyrophosphatase (MazG superfamily)